MIHKPSYEEHLKVKLIRTADGAAFQEQVNAAIEEFAKEGFDCEIQYAAVPLADERTYTLFTALIVARRVVYIASEGGLERL